MTVDLTKVKPWNEHHEGGRRGDRRYRTDIAALQRVQLGMAWHHRADTKVADLRVTEREFYFRLGYLKYARHPVKV